MLPKVCQRLTARAAPTPGDDRIYYGHTVTSGDYQRFLAVSANGYALSRVEEVVTGSRTVEDAYDEYLAESGKQ